jgi:hypothetical protein
MNGEIIFRLGRDIENEASTEASIASGGASGANRIPAAGSEPRLLAQPQITTRSNLKG